MVASVTIILLLKKLTVLGTWSPTESSTALPMYSPEGQGHMLSELAGCTAEQHSAQHPRDAAGNFHVASLGMGRALNMSA